MQSGRYSSRNRSEHLAWRRLDDLFGLASAMVRASEHHASQTTHALAAMSARTQPPVSTKADLVRLLGANETSLRGLGVRRLGLFGSFRRGQMTPDSDVDLYVEFASGEATFDHFMDLGFFCEDLCGRRVEIVTPNSLSPYLGPHILKDIEYVVG